MKRTLNRRSLSRRRFLSGARVAVTLPIFSSLASQSVLATSDPQTPKRFVAICTSLGLYGPSFFPKGDGKDFRSSTYLQPLDDLREKFTVFSGLSHPDQSGAEGHSSEQTWLTAARNPGLGGFRNTISIDQLIAEQVGFQTRFPSLTIGTDRSSQSYTRSGVMIPAEDRPSKVFSKLFVSGTTQDVARQMQAVRDGQSILDTVSGEAKRLRTRLSRNDRQKLDEYLESVRNTEHRLVLSAEWASKPKPEVNVQPPDDIENESDIVGRMELMLQMIPLALQTDSTRAITLLVQGRNDVPPLEGVSVDHHNLSHHGKGEDKIEQLRRIETAQMRAIANFLRSMDTRQEQGRSLLDNTVTLFGSNLGNANSHDTRNLPILVAGGGYRHGQHIRLDSENNTPLSNLFVDMLQTVGIETDHFGSSIAAGIPGFERPH
ncbi:MAG TPA: hypothetical protein DDW52_00510 [Planctomycetaceae bacterium]|nr:hypothetical protein [Planctomycetaceae bacterium]